MCGPIVTSGGNPAEDMGDCFHLLLSSRRLRPYRLLRLYGGVYSAYNIQVYEYNAKLNFYRELTDALTMLWMVNVR